SEAVGTVFSAVGAGAGAGDDAMAAAAGAAAAAAAGAAPPDACTTATRLPLDTLSPTLTLTSFTTPACDDGISIEALSLSTVIRLCSAFTVSPVLISNSITATSLKSPMSGTLISVRAMAQSLVLSLMV